MVTRSLLIPFVALLTIIAADAQQPASPATGKSMKTTAPANDFFSGTVTRNLPESVTVVRKVPARADEYRVFIVDKDTRIEGKLKMNARVTVRFKTDGDGAVHALRIIVRADVKTNTGPGRTGTAQ